MLSKFSQLNQGVRDYINVTFAYWGFTLSDGALRMLVVLYFHQLGYNPLEVASLFLFYEFFGIITNLFGGWLAARLGVKSTLFSGLILQIAALILLAQTPWLSVGYVMVLQAVSGIAKDFNKMSAKSAIKQLVPQDQSSRLFKWVALLTGSKNALKGIGFFLGGFLLSVLGYQNALYALAMMLTVTLCLSALNLTSTLSSKAYKPKFSEVFSSSQRVNLLSFARLFLFASRDIWFVVALPVFLVMEQGFSSTSVGTFMALWVIVYGVIQSLTPKILRFDQHAPTSGNALLSALMLLAVVALMLVAHLIGLSLLYTVLLGLILFAGVFAFNSAIHSFLIVDYARTEGASMDVGLYYMANAAGRLLGTVLSGYLYQEFGLLSTLMGSGILLLCCVPLTLRIQTR